MRFIRCAIEAVSDTRTRLGVEPEIATDDNRRTSNATSISSEGGFARARMSEMAVIGLLEIDMPESS